MRALLINVSIKIGFKVQRFIKCLDITYFFIIVISLSHMPINASYEYFNAEKGYLNAKNPDEKIYWLEEMIRKSPSHKGSENLRAQLRLRLKKLKESLEKSKKKSGGSKGIRKEGFQCVLIGLPNSGKSSLLKALTNAQPKITPYSFSTAKPEVGTLDYEGVKAQIVDMPSLGSEYFDIGIVNTADCLLIVVERFEDCEKVEKNLFRSHGKRIIVLNKADIFNGNELRKMEERMKSKRINGIIISAESGMNIDKLKRRIFEEMNVVRIFTKEPGKPKSRDPVVLVRGSSVKDVAESILKGFSARVKETKLTGPSSKFPNQKVGLNHKLKDLDIVEFLTK